MTVQERSTLGRLDREDAWEPVCKHDRRWCEHGVNVGWCVEVRPSTFRITTLGHDLLVRESC